MSGCLAARVSKIGAIEIPPVRHDQHDLANLSTCYGQQACRTSITALNVCQAVLNGNFLHLVLMNMLCQERCRAVCAAWTDLQAGPGEAYNPMMYALLCTGPHRALAMICLLIHRLWRTSKSMSATHVSMTHVVARKVNVQLSQYGV